MYQFAILDPRPGAAAMAVNRKVFASAPAGVYGVEVTVPALATQCKLGDLDPQHSGARANVAACEAALTVWLPPDGATLATVRPDADSVLAMAVLAARLAGQGVDMALVSTVAAADCAPNGPWRRDYTPPELFQRVNAVAMDHRIPLQDRVEILVAVLAGRAELPPAPKTPMESVEVTISPCGRYAVARADGAAGRGAMGAGYRHAPVVVGVNHAFALGGVKPHLKYTVARWNADHPMDWEGMLTELRAAEPGWGGSASICGSPQGTGSTLSLARVIGIVERHLA